MCLLQIRERRTICALSIILNLTIETIEGLSTSMMATAQFVYSLLGLLIGLLLGVVIGYYVGVRDGRSNHHAR
jgi:ABC-type nitrate/sulfonate/bicarbonate transport system permease component